MMRTWLLFFLSIRISQSLDADGFNSFILKEKMTIYRLNEYGVPVTGKNSVAMRLKACKGLVLAFMKYYKDDNNRYMSIWASVNGLTKVFDCVNNPAATCTGKPEQQFKKNLWKCPKETELWIKWTLTGYVSLGTGLIPGENLIVEYQGPKKDTPVNYIGVVLLEETNILMKVAGVEPVILEPPSVYLKLKEDTKEGTQLCTIKGQKATYTYSLYDTTQTQFALTKDVISLKSKLDFEKQTSHHLTVQVKDARSTANFSLYVDVENVFDEAPVVSKKPTPTIPEEMPVGTVVGKLFDVTDADPGDNITCTLTGTFAKYLEIEPTTCIVKIKARIDRDGPKGIKKLEKLELTVTDLGQQKISRVFDLEIMDINDNPPQFEKPMYVIPVKSKPTGKLLGKISARDTDAEGSAVFAIDMTIKDGNSDGIFSLANNELSADVNKLMDRKNLQKVKGSYSLLIEAKDKPKAPQLPLVATAVVVVKVSTVEELTVSGKKKDNEANPNNFDPKWAKPIPSRSKFKSVSVQEDTPPGTVVFTVLATDQDSGLAGRVVYSFEPNKRAAKKPDNSTMYLKMDALTGKLTVAMPLNCDKKLGGVTNFKIDIIAKDSAAKPKMIKAYLRVTIKDVNDNAPVFNQTMYEASYDCKHDPKVPIMSFSLEDYDAKTRLKLPLLSGEGSQYYAVYKPRRLYTIKLKSDKRRNKMQDAIDVITMTATDNVYNVTALVIIRFKSCAPDPTTWVPTTTENAVTTTEATTTTPIVTTTTPKPTTESTTVATTPTTRATTTTEYISTNGEVFVTLCTTVKKETLPTTLPTTVTTSTSTPSVTTTISTTPTTTVTTSIPTTSSTTTSSTTTTTTPLPTTQRRTFPPTSSLPCCSCSELQRVRTLYQEQMENTDHEEIKGNNSATGWAIKATCIVLSACILCGAVFFIAKKYGFGRNQRQAEKKPPENTNRLPPGPPGQGQKKLDDHIDVEANRGGNLRGSAVRGVAPDVLPANTKSLPVRKVSQTPSSLTEDESKPVLKHSEDSLNKKDGHTKKNDENIRKNSKASGCKASLAQTKESPKAEPEESTDKHESGKGDNSEKTESNAEKENVINKLKGDKKSSSVQATVLGIMVPGEKNKKTETETLKKKADEDSKEEKGDGTPECASAKVIEKTVGKKNAKGKGSGLLGVIQMKVEKDKAGPDANGDKDGKVSTNGTDINDIAKKGKEIKDKTEDSTESITITSTPTFITGGDVQEGETNTQETRKKSKSTAKAKAKALSKAKTLSKMAKKGETDEDGKSKKKKSKTELTSPIEDLPTPTKKTIPELPESAKRRCPELQDEPVKSPIPDLPDSVRKKPQWENPKQDPMKNRVPEFPNELPSRPQWVAPSTDPERLPFPDLPDKTMCKPVWSDPMKGGAPVSSKKSLNPNSLPASNRPAWNDPKMDPMKDLPDALAMRSMALIQQNSRSRPGSTYSESAEAYDNGAQDRRGSNTSTTKSLPPLALGEVGKGKSKKGRRNLTAS